MPTQEDRIIAEEKRKQHLAEIAINLIKGCEDVDARNYLLMIASTMYGKAAGNGIGDEVNSALKMAYRKFYQGKRSLTQEITDWIMKTDANFSTTDLYATLTITNKANRNKALSILSRLKNKKIIEPVTSRQGVYRRVLDDAPVIDPFSCTTDCLDIIYPLSIHELCLTMPKNIIVIAGEKGVGKTAFMLEICLRNMNRGFEIKYQSSEMGSYELRRRLLQLQQFKGANLDDWKTIDFRERSSDFHDLIISDGINIIDYLEKTDEFYTIGTDIRKIFDRLTTGIAIIAIQKDTNTDYARGGKFTAEKARIYISLVSNPPEGNIAKIVSAKNFVRSDVNPNGRQCHFRLRNGCEFIADTNWILPRKKNEL